LDLERDHGLRLPHFIPSYFVFCSLQNIIVRMHGESYTSNDTNSSSYLFIFMVVHVKFWSCDFFSLPVLVTGSGFTRTIKFVSAISESQSCFDNIAF
jgi:hypothetical protein